MIKVGILGAAGYTGGELIRLLLNHPEAEIVFANSGSNAGNKVADVHGGLFGETDLEFTDAMPFDEVDVVFFCFGHGKSEEFLKEHSIPAHVKIIDLAQDFRIAAPTHDYVYGLPEIHKAEIQKCQHLANPGCFATCIQLGLLPLAKAGLLKHDVSVNAITGSTGAGQKPTNDTHFSNRSANLSNYKVFTHQHLGEIGETIVAAGASENTDIAFVPVRGCHTRGIISDVVIRLDEDLETITKIFKEFSASHPFVCVSDKPVYMKQVVNTNKAVVYVEKYEDQLLMISCIDNLLKGAVGQAVQNMNIMFGLDEKAGLNLKASAF